MLWNLIENWTNTDAIVEAKDATASAALVIRSITTGIIDLVEMMMGPVITGNESISANETASILKLLVLMRQ